MENENAKDIKDVIYDNFEELLEKAEILNSNVLMVYDVVAEGAFPAKNYEWTLCDLHSKAFDLKEQVRSTYEQLIEIMKKSA